MFRFYNVEVSPATLSLCLTAITHTFLLFHCFPYIGYMAVQLLRDNGHDEVTVDSVGWYAGLLGTAFTTGRCLSFGPWKRLRHVLSVKNTILLSLILSTICSIWFGMSTSYWSACLARFFLGLSNSLSGCIKRIAIDREKRAALKAAEEEAHGGLATTRVELAPAKVLAFMWWGSAIGPGLGGYLSNPGTYSKRTIVMPDRIEDLYPYLLPNLVAALLCFLSMVTVAAFVDEETTARQPSYDANTTTPPAGEGSPLLQSSNNDNSIIENRRASAPIAKVEAFRSFWKSQNTRNHLLAYWAFSFVVVCVDEALPLFLIARLAGTGFSPAQIGWVLSTAGLLVVFSQIMASERILTEDDHLGFYSTMKLASVMGNVPSVLFPVVLILNGGTYWYLHRDVAPYKDIDPLQGMEGDAEYVLAGPPGSWNWGSFVFLSVLTGLLKCFSAIYFAIIGVATGRTVPPDHRDASARIMTLGALCARALAPLVAGGFVSFCMSVADDGDGAVGLWCVIGLMLGTGAATLSFQLYEAAESNDSNTASSRSERASLYLDSRQRAQVFVKLWEVHYDKGSNTVGARWRKLARKAIAYNRMTNLTDKKSDADTEEDNDAVGPLPGDIPPIPNRDNLTTHHRRKTWIDHVLRPGIDVDSVDFFILGTSKNDKACLPHVLTPPLMAALQEHLPFVCREDNYWLKYSLVRDGASITALEPKIVMSKNTFIAIETLEGDVFGCFMTKPWQMTNKYEMCGESFLWRMKQPRTTMTDSVRENEEALNEIAKREGDIEIYRWTGENDDCQLLSADRIAAGGGIMDGRDGFGFIVEDHLSRGSSSPCQTYGNPCLVSSIGDGQFEGQFEVANMEVWAMTPFLFAADAEKTETTVRFIHANMVNSKGDKPSSAQSAWTTFL